MDNSGYAYAAALAVARLGFAIKARIKIGKFYETILGKELNKMPVPEELGMEMWAFPWIDDATNAAGALVKSEMGQPSSSGTIVYFDSEDCSELSKVEKAGGKRYFFPKLL